MEYNQSKASNIVQLIHDISERERIISTYRTTGYLDRNQAIEKIKELRMTDKEVATVTAAQLAVNSIPFEAASDEKIIGELQMQIDILKAKLPGNTAGIGSSL